MSSWELPEQGTVFWPVGNGDAVTIAVDADTVIQIDINHYEKADHEHDDRVPVVDRLVECLPHAEGDDRPRLSVLAITHHDEDHCSGFERLIDEVDVDELWVTLRTFVEVGDDGLTEVGEAVYDEVCDRREAEIDAHARGERAEPGKRLRIIGNADVISTPEWNGFPKELLTSAGQLVPTVNGEDRTDVVEVFVHTPFRSDTEEGSRNSSSMGVQVQLHGEERTTRVLLLGDLEHSQIEAFVDQTKANDNEEYLEWDILLGPHHCSRNAIRRQEGDEWVDADAAEDLKRYAASDATVVLSARSFDDVGDGDVQPPHTDAREVYESIVGKDAVVHTADYANGSESDPVTLTWDESGSVEVGESSAARAERWRSIGAVGASSEAVDPGEEYVAGGDRPYA